MTNRESSQAPQFDEFDILTAALEIDYVTNELDTMEQIVRDYPRSAKTWERMKYDLLTSPTAHVVHSEEVRIVTEKNLPALAKILYEDD